MKLALPFRPQLTNPYKAGFTLIELLVTIAIIGILVTLSAPELGTLRERAEKVVCMGHLRSLHCAFGAYLNDNEHWPQFPTDSTGTEVDLTEAQEAQFWMDALKDYGVTESTWQCPTMLRLLGNEVNDPTAGAPIIHYTPTQFDDGPLTPRKWPGMPWLIEISDLHHGGNLMIRADGAVQSFNQAMMEAQAGGG